MDSIISALIGGGVVSVVFGFIEFMIRRHDSRQDKQDEILSAIKGIRSRVDAMEAKEDERDAIGCRVRILHFCDELQEGRHHSKDSFDQCLSDISTYEGYCDRVPTFKNNQTALTVQYIKRVYAERLEKHDFL